MVDMIVYLTAYLSTLIPFLCAAYQNDPQLGAAGPGIGRPQAEEVQG